MNTVTPEPCLLLSYLHSVLLWLVGLGMYDLFYIRGIYRYNYYVFIYYYKRIL